MLGKTHIAFGLGVSSLVVFTASELKIFTPSLTNLTLFYTALSIGAIFPDIDEPNSMLGKKTLGISNLLKAIFGHRGFTHSLIFVSLLALLLFSLSFIPSIQSLTLFSPPLILLCISGFILGCLLHILGDMMTYSGVPIFLPFNLKNYHTLPKILRFKTGGKMDYLIATFSLMLFAFINAELLGMDILALQRAIKIPF